MRYCWFHEPVARPSFSSLAIEIEKILHTAAKLAKAVSYFLHNIKKLVGYYVFGIFQEYMEMEFLYEADYCSERIQTPETSPENSATGMIFFDPSLLVD